MPCCLVTILGLALPRVTLVFMWIFGYLRDAYQTSIWPLLGFFFLPYTTVCYAIAMKEGRGLTGIWLVLFVIGILLDFGVIGGGARSRRQRQGGDGAI